MSRLTGRAGRRMPLHLPGTRETAPRGEVGARRQKGGRGGRGGVPAQKRGGRGAKGPPETERPDGVGLAYAALLRREGH